MKQYLSLTMVPSTSLVQLSVTGGYDCLHVLVRRQLKRPSFTVWAKNDNDYWHRHHGNFLGSETSSGAAREAVLAKGSLQLLAGDISEEIVLL